MSSMLESLPPPPPSPNPSASAERDDSKAVSACWSSMGGGGSDVTQMCAGVGYQHHNTIHEHPPPIVLVVNWKQSALSGPIPSSFGLLSNIRKLNLSWNDLEGPIPAALGELKQLETLDLSHNRITGQIPVELCKLSTLRWLDLSYNNGLMMCWQGSRPLDNSDDCQVYLRRLLRRKVIAFLHTGVAITAKRQGDTALSTTANGLFPFLANNEEMTRHILSYIYLDPVTSSRNPGTAHRLVYPSPGLFFVVLALALACLTSPSSALLYTRPTTQRSLRIIPCVHSSPPSMHRVARHLPSNSTVVLELDKERWRRCGDDTEFKCWLPSSQKVVLGDYPTAYLKTIWKTSWRSRPSLSYTLSNLAFVATLPQSHSERLFFFAPIALPLISVLFRPELCLLGLPVLHAFLCLVVYPRDERLWKVARGELQTNDVDVICGAAHAYGISKKLEKEGFVRVEEG